MAKKSALIDAVLSATRSSGIFTQDIEDFPKTHKPTTDRKVTKDQLQLIFNIVDEMNLPTEIAKEILQHGFNVNRSKELTQNQASEFIQFLMIFKEIRNLMNNLPDIHGLQMQLMAFLLYKKR